MSANREYKNYVDAGGEKSFREWITEKKRLHFTGEPVPENVPLTDSLKKTIIDIRKSQGLKTELENKYIVGVRKEIIIGGAIVLVGAIALTIYLKNKK